MLGALIGDIVGSVYEWKNRKDKGFPFFQPNCRMTDDSVMTAAVASALLMEEGKDLEGFRKNLIGEMQRLGRMYPNVGYGLRFEKWIASEEPVPYHSLGNGSGMRVSPVAWAADTMEECLALAKVSAEVTHDHPDGIAGALTVAGAVYLAREGKSKEEIRAYVTRYYPLDFTLDEIREGYQFDVSCAGSVPQAMEAFLEGEDFEDTIRNAVSIGGDSDTIAAMAGAVAAAFYGVPKAIRDEAMPFIDGEVRNIFDRFIRQY
ncbi:MAG: ADP-ribosylglycohydrolase family protein [Evtepia sp.]|uniref:ADP-ribosylglycohydrolase family protein n=1 Tax=Evtepia sp. TaxID=2773933 RepID=UPI002A750403|nr:ADP-ribosylglycohydrolase family protein [Evtepia sp.]MDY3014110.1 ADP-ribosylglycohydrolase family protein [Evtepia sp.]